MRGNINLSYISKKILKQKEKAKKLIWWLGENSFLSVLVFVFLGILLGGFIFYEYSFLVDKKEYEIIEEPLQFEEKNYQKVLEVWREKKDDFQKADEKEYKNPFQKEELIKTGEQEEEMEIGEFTTKEEESRVLVYIIKKGDNLWDLAKEYLGSGFRWQEITDINGDSFPDWRAGFLKIGEEVLIPLND